MSVQLLAGNAKSVTDSPYWTESQGVMVRVTEGIIRYWDYSIKKLLYAPRSKKYLKT
ncbi:hypothetical protein O9992_28525 [Vibrio lentus]|nr:hypothetical protein [Vibrio lentus]